MCISKPSIVLVNISKSHQAEYYNEYIKPLLRNNAVVFGIELNDDFSAPNYRRKAVQKLYKYSNEVIEDLSKVMRFVGNEQKMFIQKVYIVFIKYDLSTFNV